MIINSCPSRPVAATLWALTLIVIGLGCRSRSDSATAHAQLAGHRQSGPIEVPANAFVAVWKAPLELGRGNAINRLYLRGDTLFVYTEANRVYALSASGGQILWSAKVDVPAIPTGSMSLDAALGVGGMPRAAGHQRSHHHPHQRDAGAVSERQETSIHSPGLFDSIACHG